MGQSHGPQTHRDAQVAAPQIGNPQTGGLLEVKGNALFPLSFYWKDGKVKVALAVGKGKVQFDKREDIKDREADRELKRAVMHRLKNKN